MENVKIDNFGIEKGFVFILTNDKWYHQNDVSSKSSKDSFFLFHHETIIFRYPKDIFA